MEHLCQRRDYAKLTHQFVKLSFKKSRDRMKSWVDESNADVCKRYLSYFQYHKALSILIWIPDKNIWGFFLHFAWRELNAAFCLCNRFLLVTWADTLEAEDELTGLCVCVVSSVLIEGEGEDSWSLSLLFVVKVFIQVPCASAHRIVYYYINFFKFVCLLIWKLPFH